MKKRRLPLGVQTFSEIAEDKLVYVDKTARIYDLVTDSGKFVFLARPRRFGKSLLCSTLAALFAGRRELFAGLAIDALDWEWKKHPVIHIDLNPANYLNGVNELFITINTTFETCENKYGIPNISTTIADRFRRLIQNLAAKFSEKAAVIIDEYDKPLLDTINDREVHETLKNELRGFYGVLKSSD
ncbi:MAG: AAA family ATPase, partial [Spirochaetaceae bacterium]|nr:AAA family ATPase [Spirochaetaceae bacterium]